MNSILKRPVTACLTLLLIVTLAAGGCTTITGGDRPVALTVTTPAHPFTVKTAAAPSRNGLELVLTVDNAVFPSDHSLNITVSELNTLDHDSLVSSDDLWPVEALVTGPCGTVNDPMGIAVFQGVYYDATDLAGATPLLLYNPDIIYHCPMILTNIYAYEFRALSATADVYADCGVSPCIEGMALERQLSFSGGYTRDPTVFWSVTPGYYTIAAGDEWGALAILHVEAVTPGSP